MLNHRGCFFFANTRGSNIYVGIERYGYERKDSKKSKIFLEILVFQIIFILWIMNYF